VEDTTVARANAAAQKELDQELVDRVRGLVQVKRAVVGYRRRCETGEWPDWTGLLPEHVRVHLIGEAT
jgi:hypothetical protein